MPRSSLVTIARQALAVNTVTTCQSPRSFLSSFFGYLKGGKWKLYRWQKIQIQRPLFNDCIRSVFFLPKVCNITKKIYWKDLLCQDLDKKSLLGAYSVRQKDHTVKTRQGITQHILFHFPIYTRLHHTFRPRQN